MRYEADADARRTAAQLRAIYESLVDVGFAPEQAMQMMLAMIHAQAVSS